MADKKKTPAHPISTHDLGTPSEPTTMSDEEIAKAEEDEGSKVLMSDTPPADEAAIAETQKAAKAQAKSEKKIAQAKADLKAVVESEDPDALTIDMVADTSETEAQQPFAFDIKPDFTTMDETGIKEYLKHLTQWLRDRGATVRGPKLTSTEIADTAAVTVTREGSTTPGSAKKQTTTVYEGFYEWEYKDNPPITIRCVHLTDLDALRDTAHNAVVRRYEV